MGNVYAPKMVHIGRLRTIGENPDLDVYIGADGNLAVYIFFPLCTFFFHCVHFFSTVYTPKAMCIPEFRCVHKSQMSISSGGS